MAHSLYPGFARIQYTVDQFAHIATRPTRAWIPGASLGDPGSYTAWDGSNVAANTMIAALAGTMQHLLNSAGSVDWYEIWTMASSTAIPQLKYAANLNLTGDNVSTDAYQATQATYNFLDTAGNKGKMVLLEFPVPQLTPVSTYASLTTLEKNMLDELTADSNAWASRGDDLLFTFRKATYKLNDKLRKARRFS